MFLYDHRSTLPWFLHPCYETEALWLCRDRIPRAITLLTAAKNHHCVSPLSCPLVAPSGLTRLCVRLAFGQVHTYTTMSSSTFPLVPF